MILAAVAVTAFVPLPSSARQGAGFDPAFTGYFGTPESDLPRYVIRPNDILRINVWGEDGYQDPVLVLPDGRVSIPLAQDVMAAGLTPGQLKARLEEGLADFIMVPNVTVTVVAIQSYRVFVTGSVRQPVALVSETPITVLQAIALAGGFGDFPDRSKITIHRSGGPDGIVFDFNYDRVVRGEGLAQNMLLETGDVVVVPGG
jgi:polysaccharide export outer membrane protein